jgi:UTP--glucose-1-phosphate uridylyltransferase
MNKPTKAIIAAAGFGTRFLPQTKAMPKEMLPLIDKPIIQYVVEELVSAGIKDIIIIGSYNKRAIEDHFDDPSEDLLANLRLGGPKKQPFIDSLYEVANLANFIYVRQKGPYGNATPLACASHLISPDESFIYTFADDFFVASPTRFEQMVDVYDKYQKPVFTCKKIVDDDEYSRYGVVAGEKFENGLLKMSHIVEKPGKSNAPSNLASVSSYLLEGTIFEYLEKAKIEHETLEGAGEFNVQPIMQQMIDDGYDHLAMEVKNGRYYDTGNKLEYIKTVLDFGLSHEEMGDDLRKYLQERLK